MKIGRFFWKLFLGNILLLAIACGVGLWLVVAEFERFYGDELTLQLRSQAAALRELVTGRFGKEHAVELQALAVRIGSSDPDGVRITFVSADGTVLGDTRRDPAAMESHADRPEIIEALRSDQGVSTRWSDTVSHSMRYVAVRVGAAAAPLGVVRVSMPVRTLAEQTLSVQRLLWPIGAIALLGAIGLAVGLAVLWSSRIRRITRAARSLARGDLSTRIDEAGSDEVALLGRSLNRMGERLAGQLETIDRQRRGLETLLARLNEGVMVADSEGRLVLINPEAARLLNLPRSTVDEVDRTRRLTIEECVPQHDLQTLLLSPVVPGASNPGHGELCEARLELQRAGEPVTVLARACDVSLDELSLSSTAERADRRTWGRLLVLTDITDLTKALKMRSDFVANASHELRTPLSAIRSAVETISKMELAKEAQAAERFIRMIARHSARLEAMVADLLELSRLESPGKKFLPEVLQIQRVCDDLRQRWAEAAASKGLRWTHEIDTRCHTLTASSHLLQVVLDNLADNAIKFTPRGGEITVRCDCRPDRVAISVQDTGCGIPQHEQDRVFERFYQVTASRSGTGDPEQRGTGLGLSIVRHAVAAMGGSIRLESEVGLGTVVTVEVPSKPAAETVSHT
jgi:two-component system phosphate regulon sensor histidine kinase PhoR